MNQFLNYKPSKYLLDKLEESNILMDTEIRISDANLDNNTEIRKIINKEKYFIKILKIKNYNGKILPFESNNLLIEYIKKKNKSLKSLVNKLSIKEVNDIQYHLFAIILDMFEKYKFIHGNLSENNIFIKYYKNKRKYYIGSIPLEDNFDIYIDETNNSILLSSELKNYNLVSDVIQIRKICLSLLKDKEIAFENDNKNKSVFEDYEIHVAKKIIKLEFNRVYTITMKLFGFLKIK